MKQATLEVFHKWVKTRDPELIGTLRHMVVKEHAETNPDMKVFLDFMLSIEAKPHPIRAEIIKSCEAALGASATSFEKFAHKWEVEFINRLLILKERFVNIEGYSLFDIKLHDYDQVIDWRCPKCGTLWMTTTNVPPNANIGWMPQHDGCNVQKHPSPFKHSTNECIKE